IRSSPQVSKDHCLRGAVPPDLGLFQPPPDSPGVFQDPPLQPVMGMLSMRPLEISRSTVMVTAVPMVKVLEALLPATTVKLLASITEETWYCPRSVMPPAVMDCAEARI